jgi:hypothetical protein
MYDRWELWKHNVERSQIHYTFQGVWFFFNLNVKRNYFEEKQSQTLFQMTC